MAISFRLHNELDVFIDTVQVVKHWLIITSFPINLAKFHLVWQIPIFPANLSHMAYSLPWWWRQYVPPKCWFASLKLHSAISKKAVIFIGNSLQDYTASQPTRLRSTFLPWRKPTISCCIRLFDYKFCDSQNSLIYFGRNYYTWVSLVCAYTCTHKLNRKMRIIFYVNLVALWIINACFMYE
jgi:hypothetical protein